MFAALLETEKTMSELTDKRWAVIYHDAVIKQGLPYEAAYLLTRQLRREQGIASTVVSDEVAERMK